MIKLPKTNMFALKNEPKRNKGGKIVFQSHPIFRGKHSPCLNYFKLFSPQTRICKSKGKQPNSDPPPSH